MKVIVTAEVGRNTRRGAPMLDAMDIKCSRVVAVTREPLSGENHVTFACDEAKRKASLEALRTAWPPPGTNYDHLRAVVDIAQPEGWHVVGFIHSGHGARDLANMLDALDPAAEIRVGIVGHDSMAHALTGQAGRDALRRLLAQLRSEEDHAASEPKARALVSPPRTTGAQGALKAPQ